MYLIKISDDNGELCFSSPNEHSVFSAMEKHCKNPENSLLEVILPSEEKRILAMVTPDGNFWHAKDENPINQAGYFLHLFRHLNA